MEMKNKFPPLMVEGMGRGICEFSALQRDDGGF